MSGPIESYDVIIAGAGPVGLLLACEVRLAGVSVLVLERDEDSYSPHKGPPFGLRGLSVLTTEALDRRGLLDLLRGAVPAAALPAHWQQHRREPGGHFAGIQFFHDQVDQARWPYRPSQPIRILATTMERMEAVLTERAEALGVHIRRGCGVERLEHSNDCIVVEAGAERYTALWLVGCDGGRSTVRKAAGIDFVGTEPEFTGYSVEATLADPDMLRPGRHYTATGMYIFTPPGTIGIADFDAGAFHRTDPLTVEHVESVLRRVSGAAVGLLSLDHAATWTDRAHQAAVYRKGRVLLAGDAAHVHSPLGGQGLNLGMGDAMNLGWKLGATIRGDAPGGLLDSYQKERHPVGERILDWSRAQVALMRPSQSSRALASIMRDLIATSDGATYFAERIWGIGQRYDLGEDHPLIGRSAPDVASTGGTRLNDLLHGGCGVLLDFTGSEALRAIGEGWSDRLSYIASDAEERLGLGALLVRPDGVVAWASDDGANSGEAVRAAARWFGERRTPNVDALR